ncbi:hypothetical protein [Novosphingopyxis sp.]|uniref:hypothetical protein n=1 Tax=Novosphingopyxis sp. TaxID=2709690 RepID=UPI003B5C659C
MSYVTDSQLIRIALNVLEDAAARSHDEPVRRTYGIRLALGYLVGRRQCDRWPFDAFWQALELARPNDRWTSLNAALNGIYLQLRMRRDQSAVTEFERDARKRLGRKGTDERNERNWGGDKGRG